MAAAIEAPLRALPIDDSRALVSAYVDDSKHNAQQHRRVRLLAGRRNTTGTVPVITSSVGPTSGINYQNLITALETSQQLQVTDLQNRISTIQAEQTGYQTLEANLAPVTTAIQALSLPSTFQNFQVQLSDPTQLNVTAGNSAAPGSYQFQALQLASSQTDLSQGFVNSTSQTIGTGTLTISAGGGLESPTLLSALNGNSGVHPGSIRITDAAGHTTTVDLSNAYTVNDVINAINNNGVSQVAASTSGGHLVITDQSGGSGRSASATSAAAGPRLIWVSPNRAILARSPDRTSTKRRATRCYRRSMTATD